MTDVIVIAIIIIIMGGAALYIRKAKKNGSKCIGCPYSKQCGSKKCNCSSDEK